jgi:hypothetical protein
MNAPTQATATATGAIGLNFRFDISQNGAFGDALREAPIDFEASLVAYPTGVKPIEEPDWAVGGTPLGI